VVVASHGEEIASFMALEGAINIKIDVNNGLLLRLKLYIVKL
jgi:hypothetical protein